MFILAKLIFKSYMPKRLEAGMWFKKDHSDVVYGKVYNYFTIYELKEIPHDMYEYMSVHGAPVEPFIVMPMMNPDSPQEILATPEQIGWWDQGDDSDDLEELTVQLINTYIYGEDGENGDIALEVLDTQDEEGIHRNVVFFHDKVTIRHVTFVDEHEYEWEDDDEDEEDFDDMDDLTDYDDPEWPHDHPKDKTDHDPEPTDADHETQ